jgi:hypothetical protein
MHAHEVCRGEVLIGYSAPGICSSRAALDAQDSAPVCCGIAYSTVAALSGT